MSLPIAKKADPESGFADPTADGHVEPSSPRSDSLDSGIVEGVDYGLRGSTFFGTMLNCINSIIGSGVLGLPATIGACGWGLGVILFFIGAGLTQFGLFMLFSVMVQYGGDQQSFGRTAETVSKWMPFFASFCVFVITFTISIAYLGIASNQLIPSVAFLQGRSAEYEQLMGEINAGSDASTPWYWNNTFYVSLGWLLLAFPLSVPKKLTVLQYTSGVAVAAILFATGVVVAYTFAPVEEQCVAFMNKNNLTECVGDKCCTDSTLVNCCVGDMPVFVSDPVKIIQSIPVIIVAFCCAPQAYAYYNDIVNPTRARLSGVTALSLLIVTALYLTIALCGFFTFGTNVASSVLASYPLTGAVTAARIGVAFVVLVSYPLLMQPCRDSSIHMIDVVTSLVSGHGVSAPGTKKGNIVFYVVLSILCILTYLFALLNVDLAVLLNISGTFAVAPLCFIFPAIFYLKLVPNLPLAHKVGAVSTGLVGLFITVANIVLWITTGTVSF